MSDHCIVAAITPTRAVSFIDAVTIRRQYDIS